MRITVRRSVAGFGYDGVLDGAPRRRDLGPSDRPSRGVIGRPQTRRGAEARAESRAATDRQDYYVGGNMFLPSQQVGLGLVVVDGWLRWITPQGDLLPTPVERADAKAERVRELEARLAEYEKQGR